MWKNILGSIVLHTHYPLRKCPRWLQYFHCNRSQSFYLFACTSVPSALRLKRRRKGIDFAFKVQARNVGHQAIIFIILNHTLSFIIVWSKCQRINEARKMQRCCSRMSMCRPRSTENAILSIQGTIDSNSIEKCRYLGILWPLLYCPCTAVINWFRYRSCIFK